MYIKLKKGKLFWHYVIKHDNGQVLSTSETYFSKSNAKRAARKLAEHLGMEAVGDEYHQDLGTALSKPKRLRKTVSNQRRAKQSGVYEVTHDTPYYGGVADANISVSKSRPVRRSKNSPK